VKPQAGYPPAAFMHFSASSPASAASQTVPPRPVTPRGCGDYYPDHFGATSRKNMALRRPNNSLVRIIYYGNVA